MSDDLRMPIDKDELRELSGPQGDSIGKAIGLVVLSLAAIHFGSYALKNAGATLLKQHFSDITLTSRRTTSIADDLFGVGKRLDDYSTRNLGQINRGTTPLDEEFRLRAKAKIAQNVKRMPFEFIPAYMVERFTQQPTGEDDTLTGRAKDIGKMMIGYWGADVILGSAFKPLIRTQAAEFGRQNLKRVAPGALSWMQRNMDKGIIEGSSTLRAMGAMYREWETLPTERKIPTASNVRNLWTPAGNVRKGGKAAYETEKNMLSGKASEAHEPALMRLFRATYERSKNKDSLAVRSAYSQDWIDELVNQSRAMGKPITREQAELLHYTVRIGQDTQEFNVRDLGNAIVRGNRRWYERFGHTDKTIKLNQNELRKNISKHVPQFSHLDDRQLDDLLQTVTETTDRGTRQGWSLLTANAAQNAIGRGGVLEKAELVQTVRYAKKRYGLIDINEVNSLDLRKMTWGDYVQYVRNNRPRNQAFNRLAKEVDEIDDFLASMSAGGRQGKFYQRIQKLGVDNTMWMQGAGSRVNGTMDEMINLNLIRSKTFNALDKMEGYFKLPILNFNPMQLFQWRDRMARPTSRWGEVGSLQPQLGGIQVQPYFQVGNEISQWVGQRSGNIVRGRLKKVPGEFIPYSLSSTSNMGRVARNVLGLGEDEIKNADAKQRWLYRRMPRVAKALNISEFTSGSFGSTVKNWFRGAPLWWASKRLERTAPRVARGMQNLVDDNFYPKVSQRLQALGANANPDDINDFIGRTSTMLRPYMPADVMDEAGNWLPRVFAEPEAAFLQRTATGSVTRRPFDFTSTLINKTRRGEDLRSILNLLEEDAYIQSSSRLGGSTNVLWENLLAKYKRTAIYERQGAFRTPLQNNIMGPAHYTLEDNARRDIISYLIARPTTIAATGAPGRLQRLMQINELDDIISRIRTHGMIGREVESEVSGAVAAIKLSAYRANYQNNPAAMLQAISADPSILNEMGTLVNSWSKFGGPAWRHTAPDPRNARVTLNRFADDYAYMETFGSAFKRDPAGALAGVLGPGGIKTGVSMGAYHITNRLRSVLKLIGLDFKEGSYTNMTDELVGGFFFRRILPAMALVEMYRYIDYKINDWTGHGVTETAFGAGVVAPTVAGAYAGELLGIQQAAKWFGKVTGEEDRMNALKYFTMSGEEMSEFWNKGEVPIRRGRWWSLCIPGYQKVLLANGNFKEAKDIQIGDKVVNDKGEITTVISVSHRKGKQKEKLYKIKPVGFPEETHVTEKHPVLIHRNPCPYGSFKSGCTPERANNKTCNTRINSDDYRVFCNYSEELNLQYVQAEDIQLNDYLVIPVREYSNTETFDLRTLNINYVKENGNICLAQRNHHTNRLQKAPRAKYINPIIELNQSIGELVGWIFAEGSDHGRNGRAIECTFHKDELNWATAISKFSKELGCTVSSNRPSKDKCCKLIIHGRWLFEFCSLFMNFSSIGEGKTINTEALLNTNYYFIKGFLIGAFYGDGTITKYKDNHDNCILTVKRLESACSFRDIIVSLGGECTISDSKSKLNGKEFTAYKIKITRLPFELEKSYKQFTPCTLTRQSMINLGDIVLIPISSISIEPVPDIVFDLSVLNGSSFMVPGHIIHNSNTPFEGNRTQFFVPNIYQRIKTRGQYSWEGSKGPEEFYFERSWLPNPSNPLCVGEDTPIILSNGISKIKEVKVGDKVLTINGKFKKVIAKLKRHPYKDEDIYSITTNHSPIPIIISQDHEIAILKNSKIEWIPAKNIKDGDELLTPSVEEDSNIQLVDLSKYCNGFSTEEYFYPKIKPEVATLIEYFEQNNLILNGHTKHLLSLGYLQEDIEHAQLRIKSNNKIVRMKRYIEVDELFSSFIAMFLAEGNLQGNYCIKLTMNHKDSLHYDNLIKHICEIFDCSSKKRIDNNAVIYNIYSISLVNFIKLSCYSGIDNNYKCTGKIVPSFIAESPANIKLKFVLTYLDFDGWVENNRCSITSVNLKLIQTIKTLLSSISIPSKLYKKNNAGKKWIVGNYCNINEAFTLSFNSSTIEKIYGVKVYSSYKITSNGIKKSHSSRTIITKVVNGISYSIDYIKDISIIDDSSKLWLYDIQVADEENFCTIFGIVHNSPLTRLFDPYAWEKATYNLRPYPVTGDFFTGPYGPLTPILNATLGQVIKPTKQMHVGEGGGGLGGGAGSLITSANDRIVNMSISGGGTINAPYAIGVQATTALMAGVGVPVEVVQAATPPGAWTNLAPLGSMSDTAYRFQEMAGIYGFGLQAVRSRLGLQPEYMAPAYIPKASEAYSFQSSFWGAQMGGMGDLAMPFMKGGLSNITLSEIFRRFVPRQPGEKINPLPNAAFQQYPWLPGPYSDYFEDFSQGDIFGTSFGAYRLPGSTFAKAYGLHPDETGPYGRVDQLRVLSKVAPWSREYKTLNKSLSRSNLTPEEAEVYQTVRAQVEQINEKYQFAPYRFKNMELQDKEYTFMGITDEGYLRFQGLSTPIKLAGLTPSTDLAAGVASMLHQGQRVSMQIDLNRPKFSWEDDQKVLEAYIPGINKELMDEGYQQEIGGSPLSYYARTNAVERLIGSAWESITHTWNPITTKFIQRRSALEEYERTNVYGLDYAPWTHPYSSFIRPTLDSVGGKSLPASILTGITAGALAGRGSLGAAVAGGIGGAILGLNKLRTMAQGALTGEDWVPGHVKERWEQEEYMDVLQYVGAARQYSLLRRRALAAGEQDPEALWIKDKALQDWMSEKKTNIQAPLLERTTFGGVSKKEYMARNPIAAQAFEWREKMGQTLYGADLNGNLLDIQTSIPKERRMYFEQFLNAPISEREEILDRLPLLERRVYQSAWGMPVEEKPTLSDFFDNNYIPGPEAAIWNPGVDWEKVKIRMIERAGQDPSKYGYYPQEVNAAEQYAIPVPTPNMSQLKSAQEMLYQILGSSQIGGLGITIAPSSEPGLQLDMNITQDYRPAYSSMIEERMGLI